VVGDQDRAAIDQAQGKVAFAAARRSAQEHALALEGYRCAMHQNHSGLGDPERSGCQCFGSGHRVSIRWPPVRLRTGFVPYDRGTIPQVLASWASPCPPSSRGQEHHETSADHAAFGIPAILGADGAVVRLDDLFGDREAEAAVSAEFLPGGPLRIEAVEDRIELALGNAGTLVIDRDADEIHVALS